jgi:hypothetical protein
MIASVLRRSAAGWRRHRRSDTLYGIEKATVPTLTGTDRRCVAKGGADDMVKVEVLDMPVETSCFSGG